MDHDWTEPEHTDAGFKCVCRRCGTRIEGNTWPGKRTAQAALDIVKNHAGTCDGVPEIFATGEIRL